jgi:mono/diheme cytochrome c family protein
MHLAQVGVKELLISLTILTATLVIGSPQLAESNFDKRSIGEDIFRNRCTVCHGLDGSGNTALGKKLLIPDLRSEQVQQREDEELVETITEGKGEMPSFKKKLSRDSMYEVIAHLRKLSKHS